LLFRSPPDDSMELRELSRTSLTVGAFRLQEAGEMKSLDFSRRALLCCAAVAMLAGCGGSQPPIEVPNNSGPSVLNHSLGAPFNTSNPRANKRIADTPGYNVSAPLLYVANSDPDYSFVTIYDPEANDPSPIAVITKNLSRPEGDCIDREGTLYVTNEGSGLGWVSEYALGKTKLLRIITNGINIPAFCAIDGQGNLWVANIGGPTVTEYLKGSTKPHAILRNELTYPDGIAIDFAGNIYVGNLNTPSGGNSNVVVFPPGRESPSRTITDGITWPVGIAVDAKGTLYVTNDNAPCNIEAYLAGRSEPYRTITTDIDGPTDVTFTKNGRMYEVNEGVQGCNGPYPVILDFPPGSTKPSRHAISKDLYFPVGVAYYPPLLP
jgi:hypothetical protein